MREEKTDEIDSLMLASDVDDEVAIILWNELIICCFLFSAFEALEVTDFESICDSFLC